MKSSWIRSSDVERPLDRLRKFPPLVFEGEVKRYKEILKSVSRGRAFLLLIGNDLERMDGSHEDVVYGTLQTLLRMSLVLAHQKRLPIVRTVSSYGTPSFTDFNSMEKIYRNSASAVNQMRAFAKTGVADYFQIRNWNLDFIKASSFPESYEAITTRLDDSIAFMSAMGISSENHAQLREVEIFISNECNHLDYELGLTRKVLDPEGNEWWYDSSAHTLWVEQKNQRLGGEYIEFLRKIGNPLGLKCGPGTRADQLFRLFDILNPENEPGRLILFCGGNEKEMEIYLPHLIRKIRSEGHEVVWCCDPMGSDLLRDFSGIMRAIRMFSRIHLQEGSHAGGIQLRLDEGIGSSSHSLSANQALEVAFQSGTEYDFEHSLKPLRLDLCKFTNSKLGGVGLESDLRFERSPS